VGTELASGGTVSVDRTTTIKAVAYKAGWSDSTVVSAIYTLQVSALTLSPPAGTYYAGQTVTLATPTPGALIRYTTDGTTPSATVGTELASGGTVSVDRTMTIKAVAYKPGWRDSLVASALYTMRVAAPVYSPAAGIYTGAQQVTLTTATPGAAIRYTLDGTMPSRTVGIPAVSGDAVNVSLSGTLRAIAYMESGGWSDSALTSGVYTIR
jgi:hypothetical protein